MRCLALAQAWMESGGRTVFAMTESTSATEAHRHAIGAGVFPLSAPLGSEEDALETAALAERERVRWIVADGYEFAPGYQQALRSADRRVLFIDDDGCYQRYEADLVLNQNLSAVESLYADRAAHTRLLLGPGYALLREQFRTSPQPVRTIPAAARNVLVTLGGADPANVTRTVIETLQLLPEDAVEVIVVVGGSNPHRAELEGVVAASRVRIRLVHDAKNMPELMAWADLAISAAGSTTLELACMAVPMLLLVLADNQKAVAEAMQAVGAARNLGWAATISTATLADAVEQLISDHDERERLSRAARALVDGQGARRVVQAMKAEPMHLRAATVDDARLLFEWANDPEVRAVSFQSGPILWPDHERWFQSKLGSSRAVLLIAQSDEEQPIGVARFEIADGVATISISISASFRGRGYGQQLIEQASERVLNRPDVISIRAFVKPDNMASARAFLAAGYREDAVPETNGVRAFTLTRLAP